MGVKAYGSSGSDFEPAPEGNHSAVCCDVVDLGILPRTFEGRTSNDHMVSITWQLPETDADGRPYLVFKRYKNSLHDRASLRKDLEAWRGKRFTAEELKDGFDLDRLIGVPALVNVQHNDSGDRTYANVTAITPLPKGLPPIKVNPEFVRKQDRPDSASGPDRSRESPPVGSRPERTSAQRATPVAPPPPQPAPVADDDLPF